MAKLPTQDELDEIQAGAKAEKGELEKHRVALEIQRQAAESKVYVKDHAAIVRFVLEKLPDLMRKAAKEGFAEHGITAVAVLKFSLLNHLGEPYKNETEHVLQVLQKEIGQNNPGYAVLWWEGGQFGLRPAKTVDEIVSGQLNVLWGDYDAPRTVNMSPFKSRHEKPPVSHQLIRTYVPDNLPETRGFKENRNSGSVIVVAMGGIFAMNLK